MSGRYVIFFTSLWSVRFYKTRDSVFVTVQLATIQVSATKLLGFNAFVKGSTNVLGFNPLHRRKITREFKRFYKKSILFFRLLVLFIAMPRRVVKSQWYILTKLVSFEHTSNAVFMLPIAFGSTVITSLINQTWLPFSGSITFTYKFLKVPKTFNWY